VDPQDGGSGGERRGVLRSWETSSLIDCVFDHAPPMRKQLSTHTRRRGLLSGVNTATRALVLRSREVKFQQSDHNLFQQGASSVDTLLKLAVWRAQIGHTEKTCIP
jgi:hypothetical protein